MNLTRSFLTPAFTALACAGSAFAQSDDCSAPPAAVLGANPFDNTTFTDTGFDGGGGCATDIAGDSFWLYTIPADDDYIFDTCGSSYDTEINVHLGADCSAVCVDTNDDGGPCTPQSTVTVAGALTGQVYLIQAGGWQAGVVSAGGVMNVSVAIPPPPPPANDTCATPDIIAAVGTTPFDNTSATSSGFDGGGPCSAAIGQDIFYSFTAPSTDVYDIDTCGTTWDTRLAVHLGAACGALCMTDNDDNALICGAGLQSAVQVALNAGDVILIQVGGFGAATGVGGLNITIGVPPPPPPANNDCATPDTTTLAGLGTFPFDSTSATASGFIGGSPPCDQGQAGFPEADIFFEWVAPNSGTFVFDTIGSGFDTVLNIHDGAGCGGFCLGGDDESGGGGTSLVSVDGIVSGNTYVVQVGTWGTGGAGAVGQITIVEDIPILNPANGHYYRVVNTDFSWTDARAAAEASTYLGLQGHLATINDQAEMDFLINSLTWDRPWVGGFQDTSDPNYAEPAGGWVWTTGEPFTYTNWAAGEPNDNPIGENSLELLRGVAGATTAEGGWNDTLDVNPTFHSYIVEYEGGGSPITIQCDPASNHFQGDYVKLDGSSFGSGLGSDLHISAVDGPSGEFGFVLVSPDGSANLAIFNGVLCLGSPQGRYNPQIAANQGQPQLNSIGQFDGAGIWQNLFGNATSAGGAGFDVPTELPFAPAGQVIAPGDTLFFQVWYRDQIAMPGDTANFSNMIEVLF